MRILKIIFSVSFLLWVVACGTTSEEAIPEGTQSELIGPALVVFYTDN